MSFSGDFEHTVDAKGRAFVPKAFLEELQSSKEPRWLRLTRGTKNCLWLYPESAWLKALETVNELPDGSPQKEEFMRLFVGTARKLDVDTSGRLLLPDELRRRAGIKDKAVFVGQTHRIELWEAGRWRAMKEAGDSKFDELAFSVLGRTKP